MDVYEKAEIEEWGHLAIFLASLGYDVAFAGLGEGVAEKSDLKMKVGVQGWTVTEFSERVEFFLKNRRKGEVR